MQPQTYLRLHEQVVEMMRPLPDILPCGKFEIWLDRDAFERAVTDHLAEMWTGKRAPSKSWVIVNFEYALGELCWGNAYWAPA